MGDLLYADAKGSGGWYVMEARPKEALIVKVANLRTPRPVRCDEPLAFWEFTWAFVLKKQENGTTRLLVRERVGFGSKISQVLMAHSGWPAS